MSVEFTAYLRRELDTLLNHIRFADYFDTPSNTPPKTPPPVKRPLTFLEWIGLRSRDIVHDNEK